MKSLDEPVEIAPENRVRIYSMKRPRFIVARSHV